MNGEIGMLFYRSHYDGTIAVAFFDATTLFRIMYSDDKNNNDSSVQLLTIIGVSPDFAL